MTASSAGLSSDQNSGSTRRERVARCPKCRQPNSSQRRTCDFCGSHLYVACRDCGERNERSRRRCSACGRRLHKPALQRLLTRRLGRSVKLTPLQIILLIIAVAIGYKMIIFFAESFSQPPSDEAAALVFPVRA